MYLGIWKIKWTLKEFDPSFINIPSCGWTNLFSCSANSKEWVLLIYWFRKSSKRLGTDSILPTSREFANFRTIFFQKLFCNLCTHANYLNSNSALDDWLGNYYNEIYLGESNVLRNHLNESGSLFTWVKDFLGKIIKNFNSILIILMFARSKIGRAKNFFSMKNN